MRLINADALTEWGNTHHMTDVFPDYYSMPMDSVEAVGKYAEYWKTIIENTPSVDVRPLIRAKWKRYEHGSGIYCSHCKHKRRYRDVRDEYCPKCGAQMEVEQNNDWI